MARWWSKLLKRLPGWRARIQIGDKNTHACWHAVILGSVAFLADWAGSRAPAAWGDARRFTDIWWHFPLLVGLAFAVVRSWDKGK